MHLAYETHWTPWPDVSAATSSSSSAAAAKPKEQDASAITASATDGTFVYVGTQSGTLSVYRTDPNLAIEASEHITLWAQEKVNKAIDQLELFPQHPAGRVAVLADGAVTLYDVTKDKITPKLSLDAAKGVLFMAIDVIHVSAKHTSARSQKTDTKQTMRLTMATAKAKLVMYTWENGLEAAPTVMERGPLPHKVYRFLWADAKTLLLATSKEYASLNIQTMQWTTSMVPISTGDASPQSSPKRGTIPSVMSFVTRGADDDEFYLQTDNISIPVDRQGDLLPRSGVSWSSAPLSIHVDTPFLVGTQPRCVEIVHRLAGSLSQRIPIPKDETCQLCAARSTSSKKQRPQRLFLITKSALLTLKAIPIQQQIEQLLDVEAFENGIALVESSGLPSHESEELLQRLRKAYALHLCQVQRKMDAAFVQWSKTDTEPERIILLLGDTLPSSIRSLALHLLDGTDTHVQPLTLNDEERTAFMAALIRYLTEVRHKILGRQFQKARTIQQHQHSTPSSVSASPVTTHAGHTQSLSSMSNLNAPFPSEMMPLTGVSMPSMSTLAADHRLPLSPNRNTEDRLRLLDTVLLQAYLHVNDRVVPSLLQLQNWCDAEATLQLLRQRQLWMPLLDFCFARGLHDDALRTLETAEEETASGTKNYHLRASYLQRLPEDQFDLAKQYLSDICVHDPDTANLILTEAHFARVGSSSSTAAASDGAAAQVDNKEDEAHSRRRQAIIDFIEDLPAHQTELLQAFLQMRYSRCHERDQDLALKLVGCYLDTIAQCHAAHDAALRAHDGAKTGEELDHTMTTPKEMTSQETSPTRPSRWQVKASGLRQKLLKSRSPSRTPGAGTAGERSRPTAGAAQEEKNHEGTSRKGSLITEKDATVASETHFRLKSFLCDTTVLLDVRQTLGMLPEETDFLEERAILFGRLDDHDAVLQIYIHALKDIEAAERYCADVEGTTPTIWTTLLNKILHPAADSSVIISEKAEVAQLPLALDVLERHSTKIPLSVSLPLLPDDVSLHQLQRYLQHALTHATLAQQHQHVLIGLLKSQQLQIKAQLLQTKARRIEINEERACAVCYKRIGNSAFAAYGDDAVAHYICHRRNEQADEPIVYQ